MNKLRSHLLKNGLLTAFVLAAAVWGGTLGASQALAQDAAVTQDWVENEGVVQEISLADSTVIISGIQYGVVPHAKVLIRGNASSLAGLAVGMQVQFMVENIEGLKAEIAGVSEGFVIHELQQLPDNVAIDLY